MGRLYLIRLTKGHARTLFWVSEFTAGVAFAVIVLAILFGPEVLGATSDLEVR